MFVSEQDMWGLLFFLLPKFYGLKSRLQSVHITESQQLHVLATLLCQPSRDGFKGHGSMCVCCMLMLCHFA